MLESSRGGGDRSAGWADWWGRVSYLLSLRWALMGTVKHLTVRHWPARAWSMPRPALCLGVRPAVAPAVTPLSKYAQTLHQSFKWPGQCTFTPCQRLVDECVWPEAPLSALALEAQTAPAFLPNLWSLATMASESLKASDTRENLSSCMRLL